VGSISLAPAAAADPNFTAAENEFVTHLYVPADMAHPPLTTPGLVQMGHQACSDIGNGVSPAVERNNLDVALLNQGVATDLASVGTLIQFALKDLCPEIHSPGLP
jgi:hypothetical protein